jgi:hypothetical protein
MAPKGVFPDKGKVGISIMVKDGVTYLREVQTRDAKFVIQDPPEDLK